MGVLGINGRERPVTLCRPDVLSDLLRFVADNACALLGLVRRVMRAYEQCKSGYHFPHL